MEILYLSNISSVCCHRAQSHDDTDSERGSGLGHNRGQDLDVHAGGGDGEDGGAARQPALSGGLSTSDGKGGQKQQGSIPSAWMAQVNTRSVKTN